VVYGTEKLLSGSQTFSLCDWTAEKDQKSPGVGQRQDLELKRAGRRAAVVSLLSFAFGEHRKKLDGSILEQQHFARS
jgi:hypothetical protein